MLPVIKRYQTPARFCVPPTTPRCCGTRECWWWGHLELCPRHNGMFAHGISQWFVSCQLVINNCSWLYITHRIHVWFICLHFVDFCGKYTIYGSYGQFPAFNILHWRDVHFLSAQRCRSGPAGAGKDPVTDLETKGLHGSQEINALFCMTFRSWNRCSIRVFETKSIYISNLRLTRTKRGGKRHLFQPSPIPYPGETRG